MSQPGALGRPLDWYDGVAGVLVAVVLAVAFLVLFQPILGLCIAAGVLTSYEAVRRDAITHGAVVAGLWTVFLGSWWLLSVPQVGATGILALAVYVGWRATQ
jgi:hypothetical protein